MKCPACTVEVDPRTYLRHLRTYHINEKGLTLMCTECQKVFCTVPSYQKHWYASHSVSRKATVGSSNIDISGTAGGGSVDKSCSPPAVAMDIADSFGHGDSIEMDISDGSTEQLSTTHDKSKEQCFEAKGSEDTLRSDEQIILQPSYPSPNDPHCDDLPHLDDPQLSDLVSSDPERNDHESSSSYTISTDDSEPEEEHGSKDLQQSQTFPSSSSTPQPSHPVLSEAATFVLGLREKCSLSQSAMKDVLSDCKALIRSSLNNFVTKVGQALKSKDVDLNKTIDVQNTVRSCADVFNNLQTEGQQNKFFKEALKVVEPKRIPLGKELKRVRRKNSSVRKTVTVCEEFIYVPVTKVVEILVNHPDYKYFVENGSLSNNSNVLDSYMNNQVLREHPDALDDLEVCSPHKSRAGKQKLGAFYLFLDNIPPKFRGYLHVICLVRLVRANLLKDKKYGMNAVLEEGVLFSDGRKMFGSLIATIGDNLGLHAVGGFKEGFTAHKCCRFCLASYEEFQRMTREISSYLRKKDDHNRQVSQIQTARGKNELLSKKFSINRDCILNELNSYHIVDCMPPDIMHDILEGVLSLTVKRLLRFLLYERNEKTFTLDWLNQCIRDFDFDYAESKNKPSELKDDYIKSDESSSLHQSASQMWLLAIVIPLILSPYVDTQEDHWVNFLDLLEICRIVFTMNITKWMVSYLQDLIDTYLSSFLKLYGNLIPKQHHIIHYPTQILKMGSLVNYMCMRCEAFHKYFKKLVNQLGNNKNIPLTLASRCQMSQAYSWMISLRKKPSFGPCSPLNLSAVPFGGLLGSESGNIVKTSWLELEGIKFVPNRCFIVVGSVVCLPVFCRIVEVILQPEVILFICQNVTTARRDIHSASYRVCVSDNFCIKRPTDMAVYSVFHAHSVQEELAIVARYCVGEFL